MHHCNVSWSKQDCSISSIKHLFLPCDQVKSIADQSKFVVIQSEILSRNHG